MRNTETKKKLNVIMLRYPQCVQTWINCYFMNPSGYHQVSMSGGRTPLSPPSADPDNTEPCGTQQGTIRLSCLCPVCVYKHTAEQGHAACILAHRRDVWNHMLVDLPPEWQVGSKLQLAAENRGSSMWCTHLNSLRETADALQDASDFPSFRLFRSPRVFSYHSADHGRT